MQNFPNTSIFIDETLYNDLNRASREYDAAVTDIYYYIINGGLVSDDRFNELTAEAIKMFYDYNILKDKVSNTEVIPNLKDKYSVDLTTDEIINTWNVPFDGSHKCFISNITVKPITAKVVYEADCDEKWVDGIAKLRTKIQIYNEVIARLNTSILNDRSTSVLAALKSKRVELMSEDNTNTTEFMSTIINPIIAELGENAEDLTWQINVTTSKLALIKDFKQSINQQ